MGMRILRCNYGHCQDDRKVKPRVFDYGVSSDEECTAYIEKSFKAIVL